MTGKTHLGSGILTSLLICPDIVSGVLVCVGSILPDIDHPNSFLGKNIPFISKLFKHRGFTHSLLFICIMWFINQWIIYGIIAHLIFDMMTCNGIKLLYPIKTNVRFPLAKYIVTNGIFEKVLYCIIYILILFLIIRNYIL